MGVVQNAHLIFPVGQRDQLLGGARKGVQAHVNGGLCH